jgi:hypothetical protein
LIASLAASEFLIKENTKRRIAANAERNSTITAATSHPQFLAGQLRLGFTTMVSIQPSHLYV